MSTRSFVYLLVLRAGSKAYEVGQSKVNEVSPLSYNKLIKDELFSFPLQC